MARPLSGSPLRWREEARGHARARHARDATRGAAISASAPWRALAVAIVMAIAAPRVEAQFKASEQASVMQVVDGTRFVVEYSRPRARGRAKLYGGLEPWGTTWTPGADDATTLAISRPVSLHGRTIPAGRYSVWLVLREHEAWTLVLDPRDRMFHTEHPDSTPSQIRLPVTRREVPHVEVLTWTFTEVSTRSTTLTMQWGTVAVDLPLHVTPAYVLTTPPAVAAAYQGTYVATGRSEDPSKSERFVVRQEGQHLFGTWEGEAPILLVPSGEGVFVQGWWRNGEAWAVYDEVALRFTRADGAVTGFEIANWGGRVVRGRRLP